MLPKVYSRPPEGGGKVGQALQERFGRLQSIRGNDLSPAENDKGAAADETRARIDKSVLTLPEPKRLRDKQHLRFVAKQPCLVCGRESFDPHHLRFAPQSGLSHKVRDELSIPHIRAHHRVLTR